MTNTNPWHYFVGTSKVSKVCRSMLIAQILRSCLCAHFLFSSIGPPNSASIEQLHFSRVPLAAIMAETAPSPSQTFLKYWNPDLFPPKGSTFLSRKGRYIFTVICPCSPLKFLNELPSVPSNVRTLSSTVFYVQSLLPSNHAYYRLLSGNRVRQ